MRSLLSPLDGNTEPETDYLTDFDKPARCSKPVSNSTEIWQVAYQIEEN